MKALRVAKVVLVAALATVALVIVAAAALLAFFDPNPFKPQIERAVEDALQRKLRLEGDIKLAFYPSLGVSLGAATLSEHASEARFASIESAHISVALLPLLRGSVVVDEIRIAGLQANVLRRKDGSTNVDDLLAGGKPPAASAGAPATPSAPRGEGKAPVAFDISGVRVERSAFAYRDEAGGQELVASELNLRTGRIASDVPGALRASVSLKGRKPDLAARIELAADYQFNLRSGTLSLSGMQAKLAGEGLGVSGLAASAKGDFAANTAKGECSASRILLEAKGSLGKDSFEASIDVPNLSLGGEAARGESLNARFGLKGVDRAAEATLKLASLRGSAKALEVSGIALQFDARAGTTTAKGSLGGELQANPAEQRYELRKLEGVLALASPALAGKSPTVTLGGELRADLAKESIAANLNAKLDDSRLRAKLGLAQHSAPRVSFDFDLDRLDLDRYLPAAADKAAPKTAAKPAAQADTPIDLSALGGFEASGRLRVGELTVHRVKVTDIAAQTRLAGGRLEVSPLGAKLYEGTLAGSLALDAEGNRISARQDLSGVQLGALILDLLGRDVIEGRGKLALDVSGAGASVNAIKKSLAGNARVALQDGAVKGIDLAAALGKAKAGGKPESQPADRERKTRFSEFAASFAVKDGIAHNDDLAIRTAVFRIGGAGDIDLGASRLDYTLKATVFKPSSGEGGELAPLAGLTVPLRVSGPFDAVKFDIDYGAIAASLVKAKAGEKAQKLKGEAGERAREAAKGKLRELLRR